MISRFIADLAEALKELKIPSNKSKTKEDSMELDYYVPKLDILGQSASRLIYPTNAPKGAHSEKYETALRIAEELYDGYHNHAEKMAYWDAHYTVFGWASCVVFDTYEKVYWPHNNLSQENFLFVLGNGDRYRAYYIYPHNTEEIWPFMQWCLPKCDFAGPHGLGVITNYWAEMKRHRFPNELLEKWLAEAETYRDRDKEFEDYWGPSVNDYTQLLKGDGQNWEFGLLTDQKAMDYFFHYGIKDASTGYTSDHNLFLIFTEMLTCPISTYGQIFSHYYDGIYTIEMLAFLREQKKRLDNGEDIRTPAVDQDNSPDQPKKKTETIKNRLGKMKDNQEIVALGSKKENLKTLLSVFSDCPSINDLVALPEVEKIQFHMQWVCGYNYRLAYQLFDQQYPGEENADEWKRIRQGYEIADAAFTKEFKQTIEELTKDRESRLAYLKRVFDDIYSGPVKYEKLEKIAAYLRSNQFKAVKGQIDIDLWNELDELGYAAWHSSAHGMAIDYMLERAFQVEGEPIKDGWLWKEPNESFSFESDELADHKESPAQDTSVIPNDNKQSSPPICVFVTPKKRATVVRQLGYGLDETNSARLHMLLDLCVPEGKIHTKTEAKVLADYFRQIYHAGDINNIDYNKDEIGGWLAYWFVKTNGRHYQPESFRYYLQMSDNNQKATGLKGKIKYPKL